MKNSKKVQDFIDPLPQAKRARLEGTIGNVSTSGLSKANSLPQYSQDKSSPYRHTYLSYGQEALDLPLPWNPSRTFVRNGGSPHASTTEGSITNPIIYWHENVNFPEDKGSPSVPEDVVNQKPAYYIRCPSENGSSSAELTSPASFGKISIGCTSFSPSPAEKTGRIAIPKPVYGHQPCCAGQKCTVDHSYIMDQGLQRMPQQIFEDERMSYYDHWACMHKKESEALKQQMLLPFKHCGEEVPLNNVITEGYHGLSPSKPQRVSVFSDPYRSKYMYNNVYPFVSSSPEHCQRFQMSRPVHKDLAPMYEPVQGMRYGPQMQLYQDFPLASKYGDIPQHPLLYCPKNHINVYRPENFQQTSGLRPIFQPFLRGFRNYYPVFPPGHPVVRTVPAFPAYRTHLDPRHINPSTERPFCSPVVHQVEQPLDFSMQREQNADSNQEQPPQGQIGIKGTSHETASHNHYGDSKNIHPENPSMDSLGQGQNNRLLNSPNNIVSPTCTVDTSGKKTSLGFTDKPNNCAVQSIKHEVKPEKSCENDFLDKCQTIQQLKANDSKHLSPPMPVINKVFSLAPYKAYLEATGLMSPTQDPSHPVPPPDSKLPKDEPEAPDSKTNLYKDVLKLKLKTEKIEPKSEEEHTSPVISQNNHNGKVKEEQKNLKSTGCDIKNDLVIKSDVYSDLKSVTAEMPKHPSEDATACSMMDGVAKPTENSDKKPYEILVSLPPKPLIPTEIRKATFSLENIPPHCLRLNSFKIIVPEVLKTAVSPVPDVPQPTVENVVPISNRQARYQFMELHQSLCRLVSACISQTSHCELRNWLAGLDLDESAASSAKTRKVSCLLGSNARQVWMKEEEIVGALQKVLHKLENYVRIQECPFPHVIRAGAVFIPMLVVKEVLFPQVQGKFIDQVLQEHRVELRPTTLSEERQLTQLHKQAFSSKLRRLMSLKHMPNIYPDVLNLLYYAGVCKSLGIDMSFTIKQECMPCSDEAESSFNGLGASCISRPHTPDITSCLENPKQSSCQKIFRSTGEVKSSCKRRFLKDDTFFEEHKPFEESDSWIFTNSVEEEEWYNIPAACTDVEVKIESDIEQEPENSWGCPLTSDDLSSETTDVDTELSSFSSRSPSSIKEPSDMILKLRKVYYTKGQRGQVSHYQRVSDHSEVQKGRHGRHHRKKKRRSSEKSMQHRVRKFSSRSQHEPSLSTLPSSDHRRRWVLRSAAQDTHQPVRKSYPDLVGKRIRHLYEENDKTEVWYKGVVLRIHESHHNPLKTVFEVKYDSEPEWQYYLELLVDYKKGWLKIED
ncbi:hypothetical protein Baya_13648 [Bagarius yarrelli]|uniref:Uncharacterized protein n=1 Tax=Bagarius yarrelli TaxID=175774 RepID=A0A556V6R8_BAGYA|nr:hypothetical protein Baya_13648 [Bagarius yarrelli]